MAAELLDAILPKLNPVKQVQRNGHLQHVCWCVFHPDGQGDPPHEPDLYVDEKGYRCMACDANGPLTDLAKHLGVEVSKNGHKKNIKSAALDPCKGPEAVFWTMTATAAPAPITM